MALSNADKTQHGRSGIDALQNLLEFCLQKGYIQDITPNFRIGKDGYTNTAQFYAPFVIELGDTDNSKWALFSSTSMRSDRVKGQQWDAFNLKDIDPTISKAYLVFPDSIAEDNLKGFITQNNKYCDKKEYSALDGVISQQELFSLIESYAFKDMTPGQAKDSQGNGFEEMVANTLEYEPNLTKWRDHSDITEGMNYDLFKTIVDGLGLTASDITSITATADKKIIGKLTSGGNPKTDVLITVQTTGNPSVPYTISCKRSSSDWVSVHEYPADKFADVLDKDNARLRQLLKSFQAAGSMKNMKTDDQSALAEELHPYVESLTMWALSGQGGPSKSPIQNADFILTFDNLDHSVKIHSTSDYCKMLMSKPAGNFGTPFRWTYPSKQRGKRIQLKCQIIK